MVAGQATILGGGIPPNHVISVSSQKQLPIETESQADLEITMGKSAEALELRGSTIPVSWVTAAEALKEIGGGKVMILGPTDIGKSTLCAYLVNRLLQGNYVTHVIDADIGQADIGPPTTISRAIPTVPIASLSELEPEAQLFIGHTSPGYVEEKLIKGIQTLAGTRREPLTIINTDGWVADPDAILYKIDLVAKVDPDIVLALEFEHDLQTILAAISAHSLRVSPSKVAMERTRSDRRSIRASGYRRFLDGAVSRQVSLGSIQIRTPKHFPSVQNSNARTLRDLIVGVLGPDDFLLQIGVLTDILDTSVSLRTRPGGEIRKIEVGHVRLSSNGNEVGFL
jgi:polynucleotide 5'-hydroxyl-kinase GRC3/NOL9